MGYCLAFAERPDVSNTNLVVVLICVGIIGAAALLAFLPVCIAWARRSSRADTIAIVAVLWGLLVAGSAAMTVVAQINWTHERQMRIESGYYNVNEEKSVPTKPVATWGVLALAYAGLVSWPLLSRRRDRDADSAKSVKKS